MDIRHLRQCRINLELSQVEVCKHIPGGGIDQRTLSQAESGRLNLTKEELLALDSGIKAAFRAKVSKMRDAAPSVFAELTA